MAYTRLVQELLPTNLLASISLRPADSRLAPRTNISKVYVVVALLEVDTVYVSSPIVSVSHVWN